MTSPFDTSGVVNMHAQSTFPDLVSWSDLTPFQQGFVEGLFASSGAALDLEWAARCVENPERHFRHIAFSDLSPDALALILRDCEAYLAETPSSRFIYERDRGAGARMWARRQAGDLEAFPPLRPFLSDDGKIQLEAQR